MNKIIISLLLISFLCIIGQLIGSFFGIPLSYYMPILIWFIALCLFDIFYIYLILFVIYYLYILLHLKIILQ